MTKGGPALDTHRQDSRALEAALAALGQGALVIVPTETVYGLAADAHNDGAVQALYALKGRPATQPFSLLVADRAMAQHYGVFDARAAALAAHFWPGPLTLVMPRRADAPSSPLVNRKDQSIAVRVPAQAQTLALLRRFGRALAAPSANPAGAPAPARPEDIAPAIRAGAALCLDGAAGQGRASTLAVLEKEGVRILRPGAISREALAAVLARFGRQGAVL